MEEYKRFHLSCQCIFDGPVAHVTSGKVKTNMFLIWCGPDGKDIYDNFQLNHDKMDDIDSVMKQCELYCEPICNLGLPDINSIKCLNVKMKQRMSSTITYRNFVYNANLVTMRNDSWMPLYMVPRSRRQERSYFRCPNISLYVIV